jgi:hypothetical protein
LSNSFIPHPSSLIPHPASRVARLLPCYALQRRLLPATARFNTREVHTIAQAEILGPDGQIKTLEASTNHPIWSEDRQDWAPLDELLPGEKLRCNSLSLQTSPVALQTSVVLSFTIPLISLPVYNIKVHDANVYQVGEFGALVYDAFSFKLKAKSLRYSRMERFLSLKRIKPLFTS